MSRATWSLAGHLTRWYALSIGAFVVVVTAISLWFLGQSVARELDALVLEELHEMQASFPNAGGSIEDFHELAQEFEDEHPANPMAWRVWERGSGELWSEFGDAPLLSGIPDAPGAFDETITPRAGLRMRTEPLAPDLVVCLAVDGTWQLALLRRFFVLLGAVTVTAAFAAIAFGNLLGRRLAGHLRSVAEQARSVNAATDDAALQVEGAPEEILDVANALCDMLQNIRREHDRARLMTAGMAHELRSPIQNLLGEGEVALLRERTAEEYRAVIESQLEEVRDLARVVGNLISLCAPAGEGSTTPLEHFDLGQEADLRLMKDRDQAARRGVRVELEASGDLTVDGDREALLLALHNLVSNAINWSPKEAVVRVSLDGSSRRIEIIVDDAGPGVAETERAHIFEPFYRGKSTEHGRVGYGLGLALTRAAVKAHGGAIEVGDSSLGGARFRMTIPR